MKKINKKKLFGLLGIGLFVSMFNLLLGCLFIKLFWSSIANRLFPKLIEEGLINTTMSWLDSFFIGIFLYVIIRALSGRIVRIDNKGDIYFNRHDVQIEKEIEKE